jgi:RNA polymerase sigma-70 factor (ECF subfamily)
MKGWNSFEAEALPHAGRLFRCAMWLERDRAAAEDLVQETFVQALQSFHRFAPGTNCRAWLLKILRHVRSNRLRARRRSPIVADINDTVADTIPFVPPIPQQLTDEDVLSALATLPARAEFLRGCIRSANRLMTSCPPALQSREEL